MLGFELAPRLTVKFYCSTIYNIYDGIGQFHMQILIAMSFPCTATTGSLVCWRLPIIRFVLLLLVGSALVGLDCYFA